MISRCRVRPLLLSLSLLLLLLTVTSASAQARTLSVAMDQYGAADQLAPYRALVLQPKNWKFARWSDREHTGFVLYRKLRGRCSVVITASGHDTRDYESSTPNAQHYVDAYLSVIPVDAAFGSGDLLNRSSTAGGLAFDPAGRWGAVQTHTYDDQLAYAGAAGYSASEQTSGDVPYFRQGGLHLELAPNMFGKCSQAQIRSQRSALPAMLRSVQLR